MYLCSRKKKNRGVEQLVARQAHNLEVARSSRAPATKQKEASWLLFLLLLMRFLLGLLWFPGAVSYLSIYNGICQSFHGRNISLFHS